MQEEVGSTGGKQTGGSQTKTELKTPTGLPEVLTDVRASELPGSARYAHNQLPLSERKQQPACLSLIKLERN